MALKPAMWHVPDPSEDFMSWTSLREVPIEVMGREDLVGVQIPLGPYTLPVVLRSHGDEGEPSDPCSSIPSPPKDKELLV